MKASIAWGAVVCLAAALGPSRGRAQGQLILDDPLQGSTFGVRNGGSFAAGGWQVSDRADFIYWHVPTISQGAAEFSVRGLFPNECRPGNAVNSELFHMYDYTFGDADNVYNGGYRDGPYKHFIRKTGCLGTSPRILDALALVWVIVGTFVEPDTAVLSWDPNVTYLFREEWGPDGAGNSEIRTYRDGVQIATMSVPGMWNPAGHSVRIASSPRVQAVQDVGAPLGAVYSNIKVWNLTGVPMTPVTPPQSPGAPASPSSPSTPSSTPRGGTGGWGGTGRSGNEAIKGGGCWTGSAGLPAGASLALAFFVLLACFKSRARNH